MTDKAMLYRCVISPGIAEIYSNVRLIRGFFPVNFNKQQDTEPVSAPQTSLTFQVKDLSDHPSYPVFSFGSLYGDPEGNNVRREFRLPGAMKARIELSGLNNHPAITINKTYHRLGRLRINDFCPPGIYLRDALLTGLIKAGYAPLHGSAFATADSGILVIGPPGIGKTLILIQAIQQGYKYLADDLTITDSNGFLHPCLGISSIAYELGKMPGFRRHTNVRFQRSRLLDRLSRRIPLAGALFERPYVDIGLLIPNVKMAPKTIGRYIFILAIGRTRVAELSASEAHRMIIQMNRLEFSYYSNQMLLAYSMLNPWFDIRELMRTEEELLEKLVNSTACFLCVAPSPDEYFNLIQRSI